MRANRRRMHGKRVRKPSTAAAFKSASAFKHPEGVHPHEKGSWDGYKIRYNSLKAISEGGDSVKEHNEKNKTPKGDPIFSSASDALDTGQDLLTAGGLFPGAGIIPDAINTSVSLLRGGYAYLTGDKKGVKKHTKNAAVNAASGIPLAGIGVGSVKLGGRVLDAAEGAQKAGNVLDAVNTGSSYLPS